jgi:hypothetical protein
MPEAAKDINADFFAFNKVWTLEKTNDREGSQYRNYDAASGPILELVRVFIHEFNLKIFRNKHSHVNHTLAQLK